MSAILTLYVGKFMQPTVKARFFVSFFQVFTARVAIVSTAGSF
jgi:hypothetical protein